MPSELNAEELERDIRAVRETWMPISFAPKLLTQLRNVLTAAEAHLAQLRAPKDDLASAKAEHLSSALTNLLGACDKVPVARFDIGGFACPHCGAKADEKCRRRCWYPAFEAAIEDARNALARATGGDR